VYVRDSEAEAVGLGQQVTEDAHYVSIFCPPLKGDERFDEDDVYEASGPIEKTDRRMFVKRADAMRRAGKEIVVANGRARTIRDRRYRYAGRGGSTDRRSVSGTGSTRARSKPAWG